MSTDITHTAGLLSAIVPPSSTMTTRFIEGPNGEHVAKVGHMDYTAGSVYADVANARRMVACWNACDGIDTFALESFGPGGVLFTTNTLGSAATEAARERDALRAILARVLAVIDMTEPKHPDYADSGADTVQALCEIEADICKAIGAPNSEARARAAAAAQAEAEATEDAEDRAKMISDDAGPFFVMLDDDTAGQFPTIEAARTEGRKLADAEPFPGSFWIRNAAEQYIEDIERPQSLAEQVKDFNQRYGAPR